jgi:uncharacterized DUF497 family protein
MIDDNSLDEIIGFQWDIANISHIARHKVTPEEAEDIFFDENMVLSEDIKHSLKEKRFIIIGKTKESRLLYQVFTVRRDEIRVISSRTLNKKEVKLYEKKVDRS